MSLTELKVHVVFQSKIGEGVACSADTVQMYPADIKQLKVKPGALVVIELNAQSILCKVWPSKKSTQGVITLNKIWMPNFTNDNRKTKMLPAPKISSVLRVVDCDAVNLTVLGGRGHEAASAPCIVDYIKSLLRGVTIQTGLLLGLSIRGCSFILQVTTIVAAADTTDSISWRFTLGNKSVVTFNEVSMHSSDGVEMTSSRVTNHVKFAGYEEQKNQSYDIARLGLAVPDKKDVRRLQAMDLGMDVLRPRIVAHVFRPPKGLLLFGPPGTGKTTLMRHIVEKMGCASVEISHSIILSSGQGEAEQELREIFLEASRRAPCCILIDNVDLLCCQRSKTGVSELQKRIVSCMLSLIDGLTSREGDVEQRVFILATTTKPSDVDSALRRSGRLDREIEVGVPSVPEREAILRLLLETSSIHVCGAMDPQDDFNKDTIRKFRVSDLLVRDIARLAHGMVGADLLLVIKEAFFLALKRQVACSLLSVSEVERVATAYVGHDSMSVNLTNEFDSLSLNGNEESPSPRKIHDVLELHASTHPLLVDKKAFLLEIDFREALSRVSPSALREVVVEVPSVRWTDIGGMESVKQALKEVVEWPMQHPELFQSLGIAPPKGVLLYGPPGCSKTLMAKALATESSMNFLAGSFNSISSLMVSCLYCLYSVKGPELLSKWLGESEKAIQTLFRRARAAAPSIIFFDEIDALAGKRGDTSSGVGDRVLSQLLTELDGIQGLNQVIVLAATNRPDMLDKALIRPGRIDRKIYVPPPDSLSREQILRIELRKMPLRDKPDGSGVDFPRLVQLSAGFSGAEIVAVTSEAAMLAIEEDCLQLNEEHLFSAIAGIKPQITTSMLQFYEKFSTKL